MKITTADGKVAVVLGAGPCGLRLAMELQMLGAKTIVVEKREQMTRNNVLRLWPFIMEDLKQLGYDVSKVVRSFPSV